MAFTTLKFKKKANIDEHMLNVGEVYHHICQAFKIMQKSQDYVLVIEKIEDKLKMADINISRIGFVDFMQYKAKDLLHRVI